MPWKQPASRLRGLSPQASQPPQGSQRRRANRLFRAAPVRAVPERGVSRSRIRPRTYRRNPRHRRIAGNPLARAGGEHHGDRRGPGEKAQRSASGKSAANRPECELCRRQFPRPILSATRYRRTKSVCRSAQSVRGSAYRQHRLQRPGHDRRRLRHRAGRNTARAAGHAARRQRAGGTDQSTQRATRRELQHAPERSTGQLRAPGTGREHRRPSRRSRPVEPGLCVPPSERRLCGQWLSQARRHQQTR